MISKNWLRGEIITGTVIMTFLLTTVLPALITIAAREIQSAHSRYQEEQKVKKSHRDISFYNKTSTKVYVKVFGQEYGVPIKDELHLPSSIEDSLKYGASLAFPVFRKTEDGLQTEDNTCTGVFKDSTRMIITNNSHGVLTCYATQVV